MKKFLVLLLSLFALFGFTACDDNGNSGNNIEQKDEYTVTFNSNGGSTVSSTTVQKGTIVEEPAAPTKEGYDFMGWYKDEECTKKWSFSSNLVTSDITLYAKWEEHIEEPLYEVITVKEAIEIATALKDGETSTVRYQISATVVSIDNPSYGQMTIADETGEISVYGTYSADGEKRYAELEDKPYSNDKIVLAALLQNFKGTPEISSGWILDFEHVEIEIDESEYKEMTVLEARNEEKGSKIKLTGVVAQITYANGMVPSGFYLVDGTNSIYVYDSQIAPRVSIGNTVTVIGEKDAWILADEMYNAEKFGYKGCTQLSKAYLISNDGKVSDFDKTWIPEATVKEIMETPVSTDITTTIFKVNALVTKSENPGFTNYYINDLDGYTGSYIYTQCNGSDLAWLEEFDGKICTVYLSAINAKSTAAACTWRFLAVAVQYENFVFDIAEAPEFVVEYHALKQFEASYTGNPQIPLVTTVSSELLGFSGVTLTYTSSDENVIFFEQEGNDLVFNTKNAGTATITIKATLGNNEFTKTVEVVVNEPPKFEALTVKEAIDATFNAEITVKGIAGPSLVNQVGFYLIDETGVLAVKTDATTMASIKFGQEVVMKGIRKQYVKETTVGIFGQSCLLDAVLVVNLYGNHEYSTATFITGKNLEFIKNLPASEDHSTEVYIVEAEIEYVETAFYTTINIKDGAVSLGLYNSSAKQYNWLKEFSGQRVTLAIAPCNWNDKGEYKGCALSATSSDGTTIYNTLNYTN